MRDLTPSPRPQPPGSWVDEWGACKVCEGEIPTGHTPDCEYYKLECKLQGESNRADKHELLVREIVAWFVVIEQQYEGNTIVGEQWPKDWLRRVHGILGGAVETTII